MADKAQQLYVIASGNATTKTIPMVHVRVQGRSRDIALDTLDVGTGSPDEAIKSAVARFMEISPTLLRDTVIERHENGNITLRPEAVFG